MTPYRGRRQEVAKNDADDGQGGKMEVVRTEENFLLSVGLLLLLSV